MDLNLDACDPHGHGIDSECDGVGETEIAYRIEQAYLRGFSQGIAAVFQFWEDHNPDDAIHAMDEVERAQEWAMERRIIHANSDQYVRIYMMDALRAYLAKERASDD